MDSDFDVDDIKSLNTAENHLEKSYNNYYTNFENDSNTNMHDLAKRVDTELRPYNKLYDNEEQDNPLEVLSKVFLDIDSQVIFSLNNYNLHLFILRTIKMMWLKASERVFRKLASPKSDYYQYNKKMEEWYKDMQNYETTLQNMLNEEIITEYMQVNNESTPHSTPHITPPRTPPRTPPPIIRKQHSYHPSFLQYPIKKLRSLFKTRTNKKKGGIATRKKKYRRRYKKQIKRRTKKTRSTH
jgi:hypothetical protein